MHQPYRRKSEALWVDQMGRKPFSPSRLTSPCPARVREIRIGSWPSRGLVVSEMCVKRVLVVRVAVPGWYRVVEVARGPNSALAGIRALKPGCLVPI
jgi:hypothetical protein